ncbi:hypothetical protein MHH81_20660 [Psychrobacillus sp. FSL H8-0484]|uniref:hypothetical protein n=1 Tax=Psychrobacillus sp. FSL H8-0484 TaxID=2921390 RepID=UPI0030F87E4D
MDRNDIRSNMHVSLFKWWSSLQEAGAADVSYELEGWKVTYQHENLELIKKGYVIASCNSKKTYLNESIDRIFDIPMEMLKKQCDNLLKIVI